jgi:hypothetical protein
MEPHCVVYANSLNGHTIEFMEKQIEWEHKWEKDVMYYNIEYHDSLKLISKKKLATAVNLAMTTWDIEIPMKFKPFSWLRGDILETVTGPDISIRFKTPDEDEYFQRKPSVLAYAYLPGQGSYSGKVVFNAAYIWDLKGKGIRAEKAVELGLVEQATPGNILRTYNIYHVLIHELGHTLGLKHDATGVRDGKDVMDPFYSGVLELSDRDVLRIRAKYGVRVFSRWSRYNRLKTWLHKRLRR